MNEWMNEKSSVTTRISVVYIQMDQGGSLIVAGFDDGVVRLLRLGRTTKLDPYGRKEKAGPGFLTLLNALKPHSGRVTCLAVDHTCQLLASAVRSDSTESNHPRAVAETHAHFTQSLSQLTSIINVRKNILKNGEHAFLWKKTVKNFSKRE